MAASGARVRIYGDWDGSAVQRAQRDLSTFQQQATGFSGAIGKSFLGMGAAIGGAFAIGSVISSVTNYLQDAAQAAMQDEKSMVALAKAMDNVGQGFANADAEQFVSKLMLATGTADDLIRNGLQRLVTATGDAAQAQELLTTALDISAATGRDVVAVSQALARASTGQVSALTRLGIPLDANIVKSKDFAAAVDSLNQRFGGQAAAAADTYGGRLQRLEVAAGEAQETIGYALLDAIENVTDAFGGAGGFQDVLLEAGEYAANLVAGLGQAVGALADIAAASQDAQVGIDGASVSLFDLGKEAVLALPGIGLQLRAIGALADSGEDYRLQQDRVNASLRASEALYAGYAASADGAAAAQRGIEMSAEDAEEALKALKDEANRLKGVISDSQSLDDYRRKLMDLDDTLKGNARNFSNSTDAGRENRDTLRELFSDAADQASRWAEKTGASTAEFERKFDGLASRIVSQFVADGFKRSDVEKFLADQGIWQSTIQRLGPLITDESRKLGVNISRGVSVGIQSQESTVATAMSGTVLAAIQSAKNAAKIKSPSEVTRDEVGIPLVDGIIVGLGSKKEALKAAAQENAQVIIDAASEMVSGWDSELNRLKGVYDDALAEFNQFKQGISAGILGDLDLGAAVTEAEATGGSVVEAFKKQAAGIGTFAQQLIDLTKTNLSQSAWQAVAALGAERGTGIAAAMLGAQGAETIAGINEVYAAVETMANAVGEQAAVKFYQQGVDDAQRTYEGFRDNFGEGGPARNALMNLMDRLAAAMNRTATITVTTVNRTINQAIDGKRAAGGPVAAGKSYLVGEQGPELLVMGNQPGYVVANHDLPTAAGGAGRSAGGNVYLTVNAGMGTDGAEVGRQVVDALKRYERANGPLPLKVA